MEYTRKNLTEGAAIDLFVAYRFLRILTTPWEDQPAFKHGIVDKDGKLLRKAKELDTSEEKNSFTLLHRLIFNLKRLLHKIPGVKTKIGTYATALFLLKQHFASQVDEEDTIENTFKSWLVDTGHATEEELEEAYQQSAASKEFQARMKKRKPKIGRPKEPEKLSKFLSRAKKAGYKVKKEEIDEEVIGLGDVLPKGTYKILVDIVPNEDYPGSAKKGDIVVAFSDTSPTDAIMGQNIFTVIHQKSKEEIYVSLEDIEEI